MAEKPPQMDQWLRSLRGLDAPADRTDYVRDLNALINKALARIGDKQYLRNMSAQYTGHPWLPLQCVAQTLRARSVSRGDHYGWSDSCKLGTHGRQRKQIRDPKLPGLLREIRNRAGLTRWAAGHRFGIPPPTWAKIERGRLPGGNCRDRIAIAAQSVGLSLDDAPVQYEQKETPA